MQVGPCGVGIKITRELISMEHNIHMELTVYKEVGRGSWGGGGGEGGGRGSGKV